MARKATRKRTKRAAKAPVKSMAAARAPIPASVVGLMRGPTIHEIPVEALLGYGGERSRVL